MSKLLDEDQKSRLAIAYPDLYEQTLRIGVETEALPGDVIVLTQLVGGEGRILLDVLAYVRLDSQPLTFSQQSMVAAFLVGVRDDVGAYSVSFPKS